jgi:hypothetical protein
VTSEKFSFQQKDNHNELEVNHRQQKSSPSRKGRKNETLLRYDRGKATKRSE